MSAPGSDACAFRIIVDKYLCLGKFGNRSNTETLSVTSVDGARHSQYEDEMSPTCNQVSSHCQFSNHARRDQVISLLAGGLDRAESNDRSTGRTKDPTPIPSLPKHGIPNCQRNDARSARTKGRRVKQHHYVNHVIYSYNAPLGCEEAGEFVTVDYKDQPLPLACSCTINVPFVCKCPQRKAGGNHDQQGQREMACSSPPHLCGLKETLCCHHKQIEMTLSTRALRPSIHTGQEKEKTESECDSVDLDSFSDITDSGTDNYNGHIQPNELSLTTKSGSPNFVNVQGLDNESFALDGEHDPVRSGLGSIARGGPHYQAPSRLGGQTNGTHQKLPANCPSEACQPGDLTNHTKKDAARYDEPAINASRYCADWSRTADSVRRTDPAKIFTSERIPQTTDDDDYNGLRCGGVCGQGNSGTYLDELNSLIGRQTRRATSYYDLESGTDFDRGCGNSHRMSAAIDGRVPAICTQTTSLKGMLFGEKLQGRSSHDALIALQDAEIQLLENIRKCLALRIKIDRDYAHGLGELVTAANKLDTSDFKTPLFEAWHTIVKETEAQQKLIKENTDRLCQRTLDRLCHLISGKKAARKYYVEERQRLEVEFLKLYVSTLLTTFQLQEEPQKHKGEYEKLLEKHTHEKVKYDDMFAKAKPGSKFEEAKTRYMKSGAKLHKMHNSYVISLRDVTLHQGHYLSTILPGLLNYQQSVQEAMVSQGKQILEDYVNYTSTSSEKFVTSQKKMKLSVDTVNPATEYLAQVEKNKSDPLESSRFEFDKKLLDGYRGTLVVDEIALDDLTVDSLKDHRAVFTDRLTSGRLQKKNKEFDLKALEESISEKPPEQEMTDEMWKNYETQHQAILVLRKDLAEVNCSLDKNDILFNLLNEPLDALADAAPPTGLEFREIPQEWLENEQGSQGSLSRRFDISNLRKIFTKQPSTPPPSKDVLDQRVPDINGQDLPTVHERPGSVISAERPAERQESRMDNYDPMTFQPDSKLEDMEWFHGVLPREEVQRLLVNDGDFLVRESRNRKTLQPQYVLSVMWDGHRHFIIQGAEGSWRFEGLNYPSIPELVIQQYRSNQPVTNRSQAILRSPIMREDWELKNDDIELGENIDKGHFGEVYRGTYKKTKQEVAIKICRETLSEDAKKKFLLEGRILKQYDHPNIVRFIGIAAQRQPVMIVMEFVPGGSLLKFLQAQGAQQTSKQLIKMCEDAAAGMAYLEEKGCIHRDLAARNCLVGKNKVVKISDFGMSREEEVYRVSDGLKQIPIKWTAPEALNLGEYTSMCDVWSYGVLTWEVFSCGDLPYNGLNNNQAREKIGTGYRMPAPEGTPELVYALMLRCWDSKPTNRPHFSEICQELGRLRSVL